MLSGEELRLLTSSGLFHVVRPKPDDYLDDDPWWRVTGEDAHEYLVRHQTGEVLWAEPAWGGDYRATDDPLVLLGIVAEGFAARFPEKVKEAKKWVFQMKGILV